MKNGLCCLLAILVLISCAVTVKQTADIRELHLKGNVESIEKMKAYTDKLSEPIMIDDLAFATTLFQRFDRRGNLVEEMVFSEYGELIHYDKYILNRKGQRITKERFDSEKHFLYQENYEHDSNGKIQQTTTYDGDGKIIEKVVWHYENDEKKEVFNSSGEKIQETISRFDENNHLSSKLIIDFRSSKHYQTAVTYNKQGKKIAEKYHNRNDEFQGKIVWSYGENSIRKDEFNSNSFTLRKEKEFDENGLLVIERLFIPTFQPRMKEIDWDKDYSEMGDFRFNPENYHLYQAEEKKILYEFDEAGNWVLQKMYVNKKLSQITERVISYY